MILQVLLELDLGLSSHWLHPRYMNKNADSYYTMGMFHKDPKLNLSLSWTKQLWNAISILENILLKLF